MNAQSYTADIIEPHLLPYLHTLQQPLFQQDHAQPHTAKVTLASFEDAGVALLS